MSPQQAKALDRALEVAKLYPVFPVTIDRRGRKLPTVKDWPNVASQYADRICEMWHDHPGELVGVPMGARSGLMALDVDTAKHNEAVDWLDEHHWALPLTQSHTTRSGGVHFLYRWVDGIGNTVGKLAIGIDTRGHRGFVVWWPAVDLPIRNEGLIADCPTWLVEAVRPKPKQKSSESIAEQSEAVADAGIDGLIRVVANAHEGTKTNCLFWASCRMAKRVEAKQISSEKAIDYLVEAAERAGWEKEEALKHIENGLVIGGAG